jgi:hypothetical protein
MWTKGRAMKVPFISVSREKIRTIEHMINWSYIFIAWCCYKNRFNIIVHWFKSKQKSNLASISTNMWFSKLIGREVTEHSLRSTCNVRKWKHVIWYFSLPSYAMGVTWPSVTRVFHHFKRDKNPGLRACIPGPLGSYYSIYNDTKCFLNQLNCRPNL